MAKFRSSILSRRQNFLILTLVFSFSCAHVDRTRTAELHLQIGTGHLMKSRYPDAIRELRIAEEMDPDNAIVQNHLAIALYARQQLADAEKHLLRALDIKPDYSEARNNLGRLLIDAKKYDRAIDELKTVISDLTYNQPERAHTNLALAYLRMKNYKLAQKSAEAALNLSRSDCIAKGLLGQIFYYQKQYALAATNLDTAVELCKNLDEAHYFGALSYLSMGEREKARARMKELISLYPESHFSDKARIELKNLE